MGFNKEHLPRTGGKVRHREAHLHNPKRITGICRWAETTKKPPRDELLLKIKLLIQHAFLLGITKGKKHTAKQIAAWGEEICPHFKAYPMKKRECTLCWRGLQKEVERK